MRLSEDVIRYLTVKQTGALPTPRVSSNNETTEEKSNKEEATSTDSAKKEEK